MTIFESFGNAAAKEYPNQTVYVDKDSIVDIQQSDYGKRLYRGTIQIRDKDGNILETIEKTYSL